MAILVPGAQFLQRMRKENMEVHTCPLTKTKKAALYRAIAGMAGRPKGSRNKLGEQFLSDLQADWRNHSARAIEDVRRKKPDAYLKVVASLLPKIVRVEDGCDLTDDELTARIKQLAEYAGFALGSLTGTGEPSRREEDSPRPN